MYKLKEKVENIKSFAIDNRGKLLVSCDFKVRDYYSNKTLLESREDLLEIYFSRSNFYINSIYGKGIYFDNNLNPIEKDSHINFIDYPYIITSKRKNEKKNTFIIDEEKRIEIELENYSTIFFISNGKYFRNNFEENSIEVFSFPQGQKILTYSLPNNLKQLKFIDLLGDQLFVGFNNINILILDVCSGKLLNDYRILETYPDLSDYLEDNVAVSYSINEEKNILVVLTRVALFHIDLFENQILLIKDFINLPKEDRWEFKSASIKDDKIYFTGDYGGQYVFATRAGIMSIETGEILWQEQLKDTGGLPNAPQVTDDKLYVLSVNKQLYIFQKEETIS